MKHALTSWQVYMQCRGSCKARENLFRTIWKGYQKRLIWFIRNFVKEDAEDVFQEIMLKVFRHIETFNPIYTFNTWVYTIARNHCLNCIRARQAPSVPIDTLDDVCLSATPGGSPEDRTICLELRQIIDRVLAEFDQEHRQVAFLRFYEGMKHREIAKVMGVPTGTVKSRLFTVRAQLKEVLEKYNENE